LFREQNAATAHLMSNWIWPVVEGNWAVLAKKNVWATYSDKAQSKVRKGDQIAFYVKGTGNFRAAYRLTSDWYAAKEPIWYDEMAANKVRYKHQVAVELLELGSANYKSLVHSLSFVKNKKQISVYLQSMGGGPANHGRPISDDDLAVILVELQRNPGPPEEIPHVEEGPGAFVNRPSIGSGLLRPTTAVLPWLFQDLESVARGSINREKYIEGRDPSTIFEDLVFLAFRFLGYNTSRQLGYKRGAGRPGPDGEARSSNSDYVVVYDVKQRADGYALSAADHRALREYVEAAQGRGDANVFCLVVSSAFSGEPRPMNGVPLTFISASALLELVALKVQNPDVVNSRTLRKLFGTTGILTHRNIEQWASDHDADRLDMSHLLKLTTERIG
jgi:predicted RNA-binding protein